MEQRARANEKVDRTVREGVLDRLTHLGWHVRVVEGNAPAGGALMPEAKPILFSGQMLAGRKTQTRRVLSPDNIRLMRGGVYEPIVTYTPDKDQLRDALHEAQNMRMIDGILTWHQNPEYADGEPVGPVIHPWMARLKYSTGDLLWVRETIWQASPYPGVSPCGEPDESWRWSSRLVHYAANGNPPNCAESTEPKACATELSLRPIHMPSG